MLENMLTGSYKGVEFLVSSSSISFGQKSASYDFPNSDRTEVELFGISQDGFSLNLYTFGSGYDYWTRRNALKKALSSPEAGILVHPYEGQKKCNVLGKVKLDESDKESGIAKFTVIFQEVSDKIYPTTTEDRSYEIGDGLQYVGQQLETDLGAIYKVTKQLRNSYNNAIDSVDDITSGFDTISTTYDIMTEYIDALSSNIIDLKRKKFTIVESATDYGRAIGTLFESILWVTNDPSDNVKMYSSLFNYGEYEFLEEKNQERIEINKNNEAMQVFVRGYALAQAYSVAGLLDYETQDELDNFKQLLEDAYRDLIERLEFDSRNKLMKLRNNVMAQLDTINLARVIEIDVTPQPLSVLVHSIYGNLDNYEAIRILNRFEEPFNVFGTVRILSND